MYTTKNIIFLFLAMGAPCWATRCNISISGSCETHGADVSDLLQTNMKIESLLPINSVHDIPRGGVYNQEDQQQASLRQRLEGGHLLEVQRGPRTTYEIKAPDLPISEKHTMAATLTPEQWPRDYCIEFEIKLPSTYSGNKYGYTGGVALVGGDKTCGNLYLGVTEGIKLFGEGSGMGLMAIVQCEGEGPYYATPAIGDPSTTHAASFCYKGTTGQASWIVDGKRMGGYLSGHDRPYPATRSGSLSLLANHDGTEALTGGTLKKFKITEIPSSIQVPCVYTKGDTTPCSKVTYSVNGLPAEVPTVVTLPTNKWPEDYCMNFKIQMPSKYSGNKYGYTGTIVEIGPGNSVCKKLYLGVTEGIKLLGYKGKPLSGMGFMAIVQCDGNGPYYATPPIGQPGSYHTASFCYKGASQEPSWIVDGKKVGGYLSGKGKPFPAFRSGSLTLLASTDGSNKLEGGAIDTFTISEFSEPPKPITPESFAKCPPFVGSSAECKENLGVSKAHSSLDECKSMAFELGSDSFNYYSTDGFCVLKKCGTEQVFRKALAFVPNWGSKPEYSIHSVFCQGGIEKFIFETSEFAHCSGPKFEGGSAGGSCDALWGSKYASNIAHCASMAALHGGDTYNWKKDGSCDVRLCKTRDALDSGINKDVPADDIMSTMC